MKHKKYKKKLRKLEQRIISLELESKASSYYFGVGMTFQDYVYKTDRIIAQARDEQQEKLIQKRGDH